MVHHNPLFVNWKEQFRVRVSSNSNSPISQNKHDIVKVVIMQCILKKHKNRNRQLVYSEYDIGNGKVADVYHQDNELQIGYEVQYNIDKRWINETIKKYDECGVQLVIIPLKKLSNNLIKLQSQIQTFVI